MLWFSGDIEAQPEPVFDEFNGSTAGSLVAAEGFDRRLLFGDSVADFPSLAGVGHMGGMDVDGEHVAQGIGGEVACTAFDLFSPIGASIVTGILSLNRLRIDQGIGRMLVCTLLLTGLLMERLKGLFPPPRVDSNVGNGPRRCPTEENPTAASATGGHP